MHSGKLVFDRHAFWRAGTTTILAVSMMHLVQAGLVLRYPAAANATPIMAVKGALNASPAIAVALMMVTALMALFGASMRLGHVRILLFMPQHFMLGVMVMGGIFAASLGHYLDGTVIPWAHIAADQILGVGLFVSHTSAVIRRCWDD